MTASSPEAMFPSASTSLEASLPRPEQALVADIYAAAAEAIPPEVEADHLYWTRRSIDTIASLQTTSVERQKVKAAGEYLLWKSFPDNDGAQSDIIHLYPTKHDSRDVLMVEIDPITGVSVLDALALAELLVKMPEGRAISDERESMVGRNGQVHTAVRAYVEAMPSYRLLVSFGQSAEHRQEQPLTDHERLVRKTAVEYEVRRRHGLDPHAVMLKHSQAGKELGRKVRWLDDQTMPRSAESQRDELEGFRRYAVDTYREYLRATTGEELLDVQYDGQIFTDSFHLVLDESRGPVQDHRARHHAKHEMVTALLEAVGVARTYNNDLSYFIQERMLADALETAFGGQARYQDEEGNWRIEPATHALMVGRALNYGITNLKNVVSGSFGFTEDTHALGDGGDITAWLRGMGIESVRPRPDRSAYQFYYPLHFKQRGEQADIASQEEYLAEGARTVAWIARTGAAQTDSAERIITFEARPTQLSARASKGDLVIVSPHFQNSTLTSPYISGYDLVAFDKDNGAYHFVRNPEDDEYVRPPLLPFVRHTTRALTQGYRQLGLHELADAVEAREGILDAYQLESLIAGMSAYTFDTSVPITWEPTDLSDFAGQVKDGRLQVQCTGAAQFLIESLKVLTGSEAATMVSGYVLPRGNETRVSAQGHAKVRVFLDGKRVVLDATPALRDMPSDAAVSRAGDTRVKASTSRRAARRGRKLAAKALRGSGRVTDKAEIAHSERQPAAAQAPSAAAIEAFRQELTEQRLPEVSFIRRRLEDSAQIALDVRGRDALYKKLIDLPEGDPLRATLRLALQDTVSDAMIAERLASLQIYAQATAANLKRAGLRKYEPALVANLIGLTQELARARR